MKKCNICNKFKSLYEFAKRSKSLDGRRKTCNVCQKYINELRKKENNIKKEFIYKKNTELSRIIKKERTEYELAKCANANNTRKPCSKCKEVKLLDSFEKKKRGYLGLSSICKTCKSLNAKNHYKNNSDKIKIRNDKWKRLNPEKAKESVTRWRKENSQKFKETAMTWNKNNIEKMRLNNIRWHKENPENGAFRRAKRRSSQGNATPAWLTIEQLIEIKEFYIKSLELTKTTGIKHHVDHIIPIQGENVSGLHVPWNLQILTASENISKGNRIIL